MLELRTFGSTTVHRFDGSIADGAAAQRRSLALLAVLAVSAEAGTSRDSLLALLWPDSDPVRGRHALTQSLYQLRRALECDDLFLAAGSTLRLNNCRIACDTWSFGRAVQGGNDQEAVSVYRGPFLEGLVLSNCAEFEQWSAAHRARFRDLAAGALRRLASGAEAQGDQLKAVVVLTQLVSLDPLNGADTCRLMTAMAAGGDRPGAIRRGRLHSALMREELELDADQSVVQLIDELSSSPAARPPTAPATARGSQAVPLHEADSEGRSAIPPGGLSRSVRRWAWLGASLGVAAVVAILVGVVSSQGANPSPRSAHEQPLMVAPFRVSGTDPSLGYLREGIVELLTARLGDDSAARAVDAGKVLEEWRRAKLTSSTDTPQPAAVKIARRLGATRVVVGGVVGNAPRLVVSASVLGVADGRSHAHAQVEGSADSITTLVERLAAKLIVQGAGEADRFMDGSTPPLGALREFLEGQAAYYRGDYAAAVPRYERALVRDSSFALAALQLALAASALNDAEQHDRALAIAWMHRADLNERDLAHLVAFAGPRYPEPSLESEQVTAWERAVAVAPDRADVWYELGERLFRSGGVAGLANAHVRARVALSRALALDAADARARRLLIMLSARANDTATLSRIATPAALRDSVGDLSEFLRWRVALVRGDSAELRRIRQSMPTLNDQSLRAIAMSSLNDAVGLGDGERAAQIAAARASTTVALSDALIEQHSLALNKGRPALALALTSQLRDHQPSSDVHLRLRVLDAIYSEGDSLAAAAAADTLSTIADAPLDRDVDARGAQLADICVVEQWRLRQGITQSTHRGITHLRSADLPRRTIQVSANHRACASILDAWHAVATHRKDAVSRVAVLDSLMLSGPAVSDASNYAHILVGRLYLALGNPRAALTAFRRRTYMTGWPRYLSTVRREEASVATALGEDEIARASYGRYLALRRRPEPSLGAAVNEVREQAKALNVKRGKSADGKF